MRYSEVNRGRTFILQLEPGEIIHTTIEAFAKEQNLHSAWVQVVGGVDKDSELVVGPKDGAKEPIQPMKHTLFGVCEVTGFGTLFPDENGHPLLHMHLACGREEKTITGCIRNGVKAWLILEVIIVELIDCPAIRRLDPKSGFTLLDL